MLAQVGAVFAPKNDDGAVPESESVHGVKQLPDLSVYERNGRVVGLLAFTCLVQRYAKIGPWRRRGERCRWNVLQMARRLCRKLDVCHRIKVEVLARRNVRSMRFVEAGGDKERLVLVSFEELDGLERHFAVGVSSSLPFVSDRKHMAAPRPRRGV